jgi:hypothetical protein
MEQVHALENARGLISSPLETASASRQSPQLLSTPGPSTLQRAHSLPQPIESEQPPKPFMEDSPTLTVHSITPASDPDADHARPQEPEVVSDDELMEELMDEPKLKQPIPKPQFPFSPQIPHAQIGVPQFQSLGQFPKFQLGNPQFQPTKLNPNLRTESEPVLRNPKLNSALHPAPNPAVEQALADSRSLRKNSLRAKPDMEPEEPEPQPVTTSPVILPRSRSTSVESESQQVTRAIRAERGIRGSSSPTPAVRETIYRKELGSSQGEPDSASKPKRELEMSDNFESELEAESQPGSDSDRDSDVE